MEAGFEDHLVKPVNFPMVAAALKTISRAA
jgi:hypothetical protein